MPRIEITGVNVEERANPARLKQREETGKWCSKRRITSSIKCVLTVENLGEIRRRSNLVSKEKFTGK